MFRIRAPNRRWLIRQSRSGFEATLKIAIVRQALARWRLGCWRVGVSLRQHQALAIVFGNRTIAIVGSPDVLEHLRNWRFGVFGHQPHKQFVGCIHGVLTAGGWRDAAIPGFAHLRDEHAGGKAVELMLAHKLRRVTPNVDRLGLLPERMDVRGRDNEWLIPRQ